MSVVGMNEIFLVTKSPNANIALKADLYQIESTNTTEIKTQSVATNCVNEHTLQKFSKEGIVATKIPDGVLELTANSNNNSSIIPIELLISFKAGAAK